MKKTFTKLSIIAFSFFTFNANAQIKLGVTGGAQFSFTNTDFFKSVKTVAKPTFGIVAQANLGGGFMFRPSLNYIQDGLKTIETITTQVSSTVTQITNIDAAIKSNNLQIPLDVVLGLKAGKGKLLFSLAPVITIGLNSKYNETEVQTTTGAAPVTQSNSVDLDYSGTNAIFKRVDWGGRVGVGYEFKSGLQLNAAYKAGLNDIAVGVDNYKTNNLSLTLSYFILK